MDNSPVPNRKLLKPKSPTIQSKKVKGGLLSDRLNTPTGGGSPVSSSSDLSGNSPFAKSVENRMQNRSRKISSPGVKRVDSN